MDIYLFIFTMCACMTVASSTGVEESRNHFMDCLRTDIKNGETSLYNATEITTELGEAIISSSATNIRAPQYFVFNETSLVAKWYTSPYACCLKDLQHILLKVVQDLRDGSRRHTQFILMNISGSPFVKQKTDFTMNCVRLHPKAFRAKFTLWFLGRLELSADGKISAGHNQYSSIETEVNLNEEHYIQGRRQAEMCICSANITIRKSTSDSEGIIKARIQGHQLPEKTPVEIQLIKAVKDNWIIDNITNVLGKDIKNPFDIKYEVKRGHTYYIRVIRKCSGRYPVSCWKEEADAIRSANLTIGALFTGSPHLIEASGEDLIRNEGGKDLHQVLQLACIIFIVGVCIIAELGLMYALCRNITR